MPTEEFENNDQGYLCWVKGNPDGLVVNCLKHRSGNYLVLHRATCSDISTPKRGNWTTHQYMKACAASEADLDRWVARCNFSRTLADRDTRCKRCRP